MVDLEIDGELAVITIDRPQARNAISLDTMDALNKALDGAVGARAW
ncbi:enoyl-CoA hydratase/isomerase [Mycolicibacterium conceptionense]|uniref:Enoyl-CoA hydratase/isomerase n=1 Tax=Mycolicibacterium conceptionense TaxID=451644 RepID=A0A0U1DYQ9_9MYCO|nr:enoyl-CoA hydratase/isomerase [Mycolicibacterium conceptionense]